MAKLKILSDTGLLVESWDEGQCMTLAIPAGVETVLYCGSRLIIEPVPGKYVSVSDVSQIAEEKKRPILSIVRGLQK